MQRSGVYFPTILFVTALSLWPGGLWAQTAEEIEALRALGYISHPEESSRDRAKKKEGLTRRKSSSVTPGYTLMALIPEATAVLVDNGGRKIQTWQGPAGSDWTRAELQPNGDLLVVGRDESESGYLARYRWTGEQIWRRSSTAHHDLDVMPDGRILSLGLYDRQDGDLLFIDESVLILSPRAEVLRELSLFDLLKSNPELYKLPRKALHPHATSTEGRVDLLHSNSIVLMPFPALSSRGELYCAECVLVTVRHQNLVAVIDIEGERLVWTWGPGELQYPHEATWLENGNILIFDNGTKRRRFSRVIEVDPANGGVVWTYRQKKKGAFFSSGRGTAQALPGGNVLIASSNQSRVFEVTREGKIVWSYQTRGRDGRLVTVRAQKYPPKLVEPLIEAPKK